MIILREVGSPSKMKNVVPGLCLGKDTVIMMSSNPAFAALKQRIEDKPEDLNLCFFFPALPGRVVDWDTFLDMNMNWIEEVRALAAKDDTWIRYAGCSYYVICDKKR